MSSQSKLTLAVVAAAAMASACKDTVVTVVEVASVQVSAANGTIVLNGTTQFAATARDDRNNVLGNRAVNWSTSNASVATVDASGLVRGVGAGNATITATIEGVGGTGAIAVNNPVPSVSAVTPATVTAGAAQFDITVTGSAFVSGAVVLWNDQPRQTTFVNATTLRATITAADIAASGRFNVTVRNPQPGGGTSSTNAVDVVNPLPVVTTFAPAFVQIGGAQFDLTITGTGFVTGAVALWNQQPRTTQFVNATTLRATILASDIASAGNFNVTVQNPTPGGGVSTARTFEVRNPVPVVNTLSPNTVLFGATGFDITVTGTGFVQNSVVRWNGQTRTTTYVSTTTLRATIPATDVATPGLIDIVVENPVPGGGQSQVRQFTTRINAPGRAIAARRNYACANRANGETHCWGGNDGGTLGDGTTTDRLTPTRVQTTLPFVSVVAGNWHACGLTSWGAAYCWGVASFPLGRGSGGSSLTPVAVTGNHAFVQLAAGGDHTCGVTAAQLLYCWGYNWAGQVGDNSTANRAAPVPVGTPAQRWRTVVAGNAHTCAITTTFQLFCWGYNASGQIGDGTMTDRPSPVAVGGGTTYVTVVAGGSHTCGVTSPGLTFCWGYGGTGQLGHGSYANSSVPVAVSGGIGHTTLAASDYHTCATNQAGTAYCWGGGWDGQLGNGQVNITSSMPVIANVPPVRQIATGYYHTCALGTNNQAYCWGARTFGALGDGISSVRLTPAAVSNASSGYTAVAVGEEFSCGLFGTAARCWGRNDYFELGDNTNVDRAVPNPVFGNPSFVMITTGTSHACGLTAAGAAFCWGQGNDGRLGNGGISTGAPLPVGGGNVFREISAGGYHTCGVTTAGALRCWGSNNVGQLGDGTTTHKTLPSLIATPPGATFSTVSTGELHTCAVTTTGQVYCWGWNNFGQVGDGSTTDRLSPALVNVGAPAQRVSAGYYHTCILTTAGAAHCWGYNGSGELGRGTGTGPEPTSGPVAGNRTFRTISVGTQATCAVTTADEVFCWGANWWGQLGIGSLAWVNTPTAVVGGTGYLDVRIRVHACGVTTAGAVRCWGQSRFGELGINVFGLAPTPVPVQGGIVFDGNNCGVDDCGLVVPTGDMSPFLRPPPRSLFGGPSAGIRHLAPAPRLVPIEPVACRPDELCPRVPLRIVR